MYTRTAIFLAVLGTFVGMLAYSQPRRRGRGRGLEGDQDRHDLADARPTVGFASGPIVRESVPLDLVIKGLPEIVHVHEELGVFGRGLILPGLNR